MSEFALAAEFPPAGEAEWMRLVERALAGRPFEQVLGSTTRDGIPIAPLYGQRHPGRTLSPGNGRWAVFQRVDHPDPGEANRLALADFAGGADGLELVLPGSPAARGFGVAIATLADLERLLDGIDLTAGPLRVDAGYEVRNALALVAALIAKNRIDPGKVDIVGLSDPANGLAADGRLTASYETISDFGADLAHWVRARGLRLAPFHADARFLHAAGASEAQELGYALAAGVARMRALERGGIPLDDMPRLITFTFAADADQFLTIAKLRAFRLAWGRVAELSGLPAFRLRLHAETAWRMMTRRDPWVNILRATVAVAAAGLGGANSVTVLPFTAALGLPDAFARRLARNTQLVLIEEAGLGAVADPAAGSGYVESLTEELAGRAWERFREIERQGGLIASLMSGALQARVGETAARRRRDVATRREPITGVSIYPWLAELPVDTLQPEVEPLRESGRGLDLPPPGRGERFDALIAETRIGATMADLAASERGDWLRVPRLAASRLAEPYERLRDLSDGLYRETGRRPAVFLATLGTLADFTARATWARNAFEAGGLEALAGSGYADGAAAAAAFRESGASIACLCGSDEAYGRLAAPVAAALKTAGARLVYLAGRPGEQEPALREAGVDRFLFAGCDIVEELETCYRRLGLSVPVEGE